MGFRRSEVRILSPRQRKARRRKELRRAFSMRSADGNASVQRLRYVDLPAVIPPTSPTSWSSTGQGPAVPAVPPIVGQAVEGVPAAVAPAVSIVAGQAGHRPGTVATLPTCRPCCRSSPALVNRPGKLSRAFPTAAPPVRPIVAGLVIDRASCRGPSPRPCRPRCRSSAGKLVIDRGAYHGPHVSPVVPIVAGLVIDRAACRGPRGRVARGVDRRRASWSSTGERAMVPACRRSSPTWSIDRATLWHFRRGPRPCRSPHGVSAVVGRAPAAVSPMLPASWSSTGQRIEVPSAGRHAGKGRAVELLPRGRVARGEFPTARTRRRSSPGKLVIVAAEMAQ